MASQSQVKGTAPDCISDAAFSAVRVCIDSFTGPDERQLRRIVECIASINSSLQDHAA